jgi:hypothetical protein
MAAIRPGGFPCLMPRPGGPPKTVVMKRSAGAWRNSWVSWQDNGVACAPASTQRRPIGGTDPVSENCVPCAFGDRDRHEKAEKNDDDDRLFDRTGSF